MSRPTSLCNATLPQWRGSAVRVPEYRREPLVPGIVHLGVVGFHRAHLAVYVDALLAGEAVPWAICGAGLLPRDAAMREALLPQDGLYTLLERDAAGERVAIIGSLVKYLFAPDDPEALIAQLSSPDTRIASFTITVTRDLLLQFLERRDPDLAPWLAAGGAFPNSMVDRITPQTSDADRKHVARTYGIDDAWPVVCEPFMRWVLEDRFCNGRPDWEAVGVQMVADVAPYELMKLRLLNAGHSALGYLGFLAGYRSVHEVMGDAAFVRYLRVLMIEEVSPLLPSVPGIDVADYINTLLCRFANPAIGDRLERLCADGSGKMPRFVLPSLRERLVQRGPRRMLVLCLAAWLRYLQGVDEAGVRYEISDPLGEQLESAARAGGMDPRPVLVIESVFGSDLAASPELVAEVRARLESLQQLGVRGTLAAIG